MIIGTFEVMVGLLGFIIIFLIGQPNILTVSFLILSMLYTAMGAGLWAIQEWARYINVVLHVASIPYVIFTFLIFDNHISRLPHIIVNIIVAFYIIYALTRPEIRDKFQSVSPKTKQH